MSGYTAGSNATIKELASEIKRGKRSVTCVAGRRGSGRLKCDEMRKGPADEPREHGLLAKSLSGGVEKAATAIPKQYKYVRKYKDDKGRWRYVYPEDLRQQSLVDKVIAPKPIEKLRGQRLTDRRQHEMELWHKWKSTGDKESYHALVKSFGPLINRIVGTYKGRVPIPAQAMHATGETWVAKAIERYNPDKGPLHIFVQGYINKVKSYVAKGQNFGAIPETRVYDVGNFQRGYSTLKEELGREPTVEELAAKLEWPIKKTTKLQHELVPDIAVPGETHYEAEETPSDLSETVKFIRPELSDDEKKVYDLMFVKRMFSTGDLAKMLKMSPSKASKLKGGILDRIQLEAMRYD